MPTLSNPPQTGDIVHVRMRTYLVEGANSSSGCGTLQADAAHVCGNECEARSRIGCTFFTENPVSQFNSNLIDWPQTDSAHLADRVPCPRPSTEGPSG